MLQQVLNSVFKTERSEYTQARLSSLFSLALLFRFHSTIIYRPVRVSTLSQTHITTRLVAAPFSCWARRRETDVVYSQVAVAQFSTRAWVRFPATAAAFRCGGHAQRPWILVLGARYRAPGCQSYFRVLRYVAPCILGLPIYFFYEVVGSFISCDMAAYEWCTAQTRWCTVINHILLDITGYTRFMFYYI